MYNGQQIQVELGKNEKNRVLHKVKNVKEEAKANLPQIMYEGMLSRIRIQEIKNFGEISISTASYSEVFALNKRFCQEKVDLAIYALNNIMDWKFLGIPVAEAPQEGHKTTKGVTETFYRGKAKLNDLEIEYLLRTNSQNEKYHLHNVVVNNP
ncbi:MAG: hypothetical protein MJ250_09925 [Alphaproteobacteria bacterium]|nr:hypothetical protein [Alphaproteobacteria bacterium]